MALALAMAREGLSVAIVGPVSASWPNNYGVWLDEWDELGLPDDCLETVYESTRITISGEESIAIPRSYGKVNGNRFRQYMLEECAERGVHVLEGIVTGTEQDHDIGQTKMVFSNGQKLACRVPVVAAGHYSPLVKYQVVILPIHTRTHTYTYTYTHTHTHTHTRTHTSTSTSTHTQDHALAHTHTQTHTHTHTSTHTSTHAHARAHTQQSPGVEFMRMEGEYMTRDWQSLMQTAPESRIRISPVPYVYVCVCVCVCVCCENDSGSVCVCVCV